MSTEIKKEIQLEIAHVLFIDIVGYSKLSINQQRAVVNELTEVVSASDQFQSQRGRFVTKAHIRQREISNEQIIFRLFFRNGPWPRIQSRTIL
jgi:hypothetical protein